MASIICCSFDQRAASRIDQLVCVAQGKAVAGAGRATALVPLVQFTSNCKLMGACQSAMADRRGRRHRRAADRAQSEIADRSAGPSALA
jgi:hypothetical protein